MLNPTGGRKAPISNNNKQFATMSNKKDKTHPDTGCKNHRPLFIRLPKVGNCEWTGLTRSKLNQLILPCKENGHRPPVKSAVIKVSGTKSGVRLICFDSLIEYVQSKMGYAKKNN